jgi:serine/threonine protein kinase
MKYRAIDHIRIIVCSKQAHGDGAEQRERTHRPIDDVICSPTAACSYLCSRVQIVEVAMSTSPQLLDKYELLERLGQSDVVETWKALDTQQKRYAAIKILRMNLQTDPDFPTRFIRQAQRLAALRHPNIVRMHDFRISQSSQSETPETVAYMVMDYVEGQTLADYIESTSRQGKFPPAAEIVRLLIPISLAIDYAHQQGVIHGDLKPGNILLDKSNMSVNPMGQPIVSDFGMAQILRGPYGSVPSSSFYTSPEEAQGYPSNDRSDLYSLGVILYELFTGVLPFQGDNPADTLKQHMYATPTSPTLINPALLPGLTAIILRSLSKDPAARFPNASSMVVALAKAINMPVPEQVTIAAATVDAMNMQTFLSPLPSNRTPGVTSPFPSSPGLSVTPPIASVSAVPSMLTPGAIQAAGHTPPGGTQPAADLPTMLSSPRPAPTPRKRRRRVLYIALAALLIVVLLASGLAAFFTLYHGGTPAQEQVAGHAYFVSSGLLSLNSSQGITDEMQIHLQGIPDPQPGNSYYAWLLTDKTASYVPTLLGKLQVSRGIVDFAFPGTSQHLDLLAINSRFLITEEDASQTPTNPSLDPHTWRYYAEFSAVPNPADKVNHFSLLDHLRHLLAQDPKLKAAGLTGGLDIWLFRNTEKILEWSGSARDAWQRQDLQSGAFIHRQVVRILDYLDGFSYVQREVPPGTRILVDPVIVRVPLLENVPNQAPPGYVFHIGRHLEEITKSPNVTKDQIALAVQINLAMNNVQFWLQQVHKDALQLINLSDAQILQQSTRSILDDMTTQANFAFTGQIDPFTGQVKSGVVQVHYNIQRLATFDITSCTMNGASSTCAV